MDLDVFDSLGEANITKFRCSLVKKKGLQIQKEEKLGLKTLQFICIPHSEKHTKRGEVVKGHFMRPLEITAGKKLVPNTSFQLHLVPLTDSRSQNVAAFHAGRAAMASFCFYQCFPESGKF